MNPQEIEVWEPFLKKVPIFSGLSASEIARMAARMELFSLPKGATLFSQGDEGDALYIIASGHVRMVHTHRGEESVAALLGRGESVGEIGLLTAEPRSLTARLDTTCEFLKLLRRDFEEILRKNPSILLHLSRILSRRFVERAKPRQASEPGAPRLVTLNAALEPADRLLFTITLSLQLLEQTRRRTILVDMTPEAGDIAEAMGLKKAPMTESALRSINMRNPALVKNLVQAHPSGLSVLNLPAPVLGGRLYSGIYLFLNFLRESHDLILVNIGNGIGDVERSILTEADQALLAGTDSLRPQYRQIESEIRGLLHEPKRLIPVWLGELDPESAVFTTDSGRMIVPWNRGIAESFRRSGSPYKAMDKAPKARRGVERLARRLGGVRVGLALGTGAALGHALIGVLKTFKREHIPVDLIAGTSVGAAMAGFTALGMEPEDLEEIAVGMDKGWLTENLFWDLSLPRSGIFSGESLLRLLRSYYGTREFSDLEIPFACVATDIETGEEVVLREGRVAEAIRASCGLPLIFNPFRLNGRYLVDGGLVNPVPTQLVSSMGADILLAVNLTMAPGERKTSLQSRIPEKDKGLFEVPVSLAKLREYTLPDVLKAPNAVEVFFQMIYTMQYQVAQARVEPAHVSIQPDLTGFSWTEFHRAREIIDLGERIAEEYMPQVKAQIPFFNDHCKVPIKLSPLA